MPKHGDYSELPLPGKEARPSQREPMLAEALRRQQEIGRMLDMDSSEVVRVGDAELTVVTPAPGDTAWRWVTDAAQVVKDGPRGLKFDSFTYVARIWAGAAVDRVGPIYVTEDADPHDFVANLLLQGVRLPRAAERDPFADGL